MQLLSKEHRPGARRLSGAWFPIAICLLVCASAEVIKAQSTSVTVRVLPGSASVRIEGVCAPNRVWSFRKSYAGIMDLGNRVEKLSLSDGAGKDARVRKLAPGEFESETPASRFRYEVNLAPPARAGDAAFVSWLDLDHGLFMPGDLLPSFSNVTGPSPTENSSNSMRDNETRDSSIVVGLTLPEGWTVYSTEATSSSGEFEIKDVARAVIVAGRGLRISRKQIASMNFSLLTFGSWAFAESEVLELTSKIIRAHEGSFGGMPCERSALILMPFPAAVTPEKWSAETRGSTVTLLLGRQPSKAAALAQLSVALTHELFHLWVPNGLVLDGDYGWFYEGFTIYEAARVAVRLQSKTFEDFLNGISRAYDGYAAKPENDRLSLIDASARRWTNGETVVYQKAMVVAFLYDLTLRFQTRGKHSLEDVYRTLFRQYRSSNERVTDSNGRAAQPKRAKENVNGNLAVSATLSEMAGMQ